VAAWLVALGPAVAAVWACPAFVTQDGPAHLYNAHVLARSFDPGSPFRDVFEVRWEPLPNWAGHVALIGLLAALPPRAADRTMTTLTLAALAAALAWLRWRVAGRRGLPTAAALAVVLGLNVTWLFGFNSFLLGAALFPVTLGVWWSGRGGGFSWYRAAALAGLTTAGYFCHVVSLGLTAAVLAVLELFTPGADLGSDRDRDRDRRGRALATALGLLPLVPLGAVYLGLMRRGGGGLDPVWMHLPGADSPRAWFRQLTWVDPVSLARKDYLPFGGGYSAPWCLALAPVLWLSAGLVLSAVATWRARGDDPLLGRERRGWWVLAGLLLAAGVAAPDTLGASHGHYLPQRIVLLGLSALVPVLRLDARGRLGRAAAVAVWVALGLQSAAVWDYALTSARTAGRLFRAAGAVGNGRRVAALWVGIRTPFRANPLLHADCALGVGTGNVIWGDYETRFYYFPVHFRDGLDRPDPAALEAIALSDSPHDSADRARRWAELLERHHRAIDSLVVWGADPALDAVNDRWFSTTYHDGPVRVLHPPASRQTRDPQE
jgi:hypothetical protein